MLLNRRALVLLACATPSFAAGAPTEEVETRRAHFDKSMAKLTEEVSTLGDKVLLVWLVDQSASMKDDQEAVRSRIREFYGRIPPDRHAGLRMAVIGFGAGAAEISHPSNQAEETMRGLSSLPVDESGRENFVAAIQYALKRYQSPGERKVLVLLTDERGSDEAAVEDARSALKKASARFYCIGGEAPFCSRITWEATGDLKCPAVIVDAGPESPFLEGIDMEAWAASDIPSGFGNWAQESLCRGTGGAYFMFRSGKMRRSKVAYDPELLAKEYAPFYGSREDYERLVQKIPLLKACREALDAYPRAPHVRLSGPPPVKAWLLESQKNAPLRRAFLEAQLRSLEEARRKTADVPRRVEANAELICAQLRIQLAFLGPQEEFIQSALAKPLPECLPGETAGVHWTSSALSKESEALRSAAARALEELARHHPKTPWEAYARDGLARLCVRPLEWGVGKGNKSVPSPRH